MVGKSQTTLAGRQRLRVVNFRLSLPPFAGQFSIITTSMAREDEIPLIGSIKMVDNFALVVKTESDYNADNKSLKISLPHARSWSRWSKFTLGIEGQEIYNDKEEYVGSNAFGATVNVSEHTQGHAVLAVNNSSAYDIYRSPYGGINFTLNDVSVENAKIMKGNLSALCIFKLDSPFIGLDGLNSKATIDNPIALIIINHLVYGIISEIIVFDDKSGEILHRIVSH